MQSQFVKLTDSRWSKIAKFLPIAYKRKYDLRAIMSAIEIAQKPAGTKGFIPTAKRWLVESTFGIFNFSRRLSKDYEKPQKVLKRY
jgi:transposase